MKNKLFVLSLLLVICFFSDAQVDYLKKGKSAAASGNYSDAIAQFTAAKNQLIVKKVDKNSNEFIEVEKLLRAATDCQSYKSKAENELKLCSEDVILGSFVDCMSEESANPVYSRLADHLRTARSNFNAIKGKFSYDKTIADRLAECDRLETILSNVVSNLPETFAWNKAVESNTVPAYESFLYSYPSGNYSAMAKKAIGDLEDERDWRSASYYGDLTSYSDYLSKHPSGKYSEQARSYVWSLGENDVWRNACEGGNSAGYEHYLSTYPEGKYASDAQAALAKCQDREFYEEQLKKGTKAAFNAYLSKYPNGQYAYEAKQQKNRIDDADEWKIAVEKNTIEAYKTYIAKSSTKAYKADAEKKIQDLKHEQEVKEDEARWASISNSTNPSDFTNYLGRTGYKGHEKEARGLARLMSARSYQIDETTASTVVESYENASRYITLPEADKARLAQAKELSAYAEYSLSKSETAARRYLSDYPSGAHATEVSNTLARTLADKMTSSTTENEYQSALSYASNSGVRDYVQSKYQDIQKQKKAEERKLNREPFHFMVGARLMTIPSYKAYDYAPFISLGGNSNRLNLEAGYYVKNGWAFVSPKVNIIKKSYSGSPFVRSGRKGGDYSAFSFYVAPEFYYDVNGVQNPDAVIEYYDGYEEDTSGEYELIDYSALFPTINYDFGARVGFCATYVDLFIGYLVNSGSVTAGVTFYFSNK